MDQSNNQENKTRSHTWDTDGLHKMQRLCILGYKLLVRI